MSVAFLPWTCKCREKLKVKKKKNFEWKISLLNLNVIPQNYDPLNGLGVYKIKFLKPAHFKTNKNQLNVCKHFHCKITI